MSIEVNGVSLPDIPSEVLEQYENVVIVQDVDKISTTDAHVCYASATPFLYCPPELLGTTAGVLASVTEVKFIVWYDGSDGWLYADELFDIAKIPTNGYYAKIADIPDAGSFNGTFYVDSDYEDSASGRVSWSNHDILAVTSVDTSTGEFVTGDVWFARNDSTADTATDTKPIYKRVSGAWVKQTAYERQSGEWVLISSA